MKRKGKDAQFLNDVDYRLRVEVPSIPGIGDALAPLILEEIGDIERFVNVKQLVAFSGIDPSVRQSGSYVGTKNKTIK